MLTIGRAVRSQHAVGPTLEYEVPGRGEHTAAFDDMVKRAAGQKFDASNSLYPNVCDGVDGMNFVTQCVASAKDNGHWLSLKHALCRS